jgi:hypothetical protein
VGPRDELVWLELALPKVPVVALHALARDGERESFDAIGRNVGEQIHQVLGAWLTARRPAALPRGSEAVTAEERSRPWRVIAPTLVEQARAAWTAPPSAPARRWRRATATMTAADAVDDAVDPTSLTRAACRARARSRACREPVSHSLGRRAALLEPALSETSAI